MAVCLIASEKNEPGNSLPASASAIAWTTDPINCLAVSASARAIARALVTHPEIILADEPTGNLDSESGALILEMLHELHREGHTIILVTHEDRIADAAHRQIRLLDGRII